MINIKFLNEAAAGCGKYLNCCNKKLCLTAALLFLFAQTPYSRVFSAETVTYYASNQSQLYEAFTSANTDIEVIITADINTSFGYSVTNKNVLITSDNGTRRLDFGGLYIYDANVTVSDVILSSGESGHTIQGYNPSALYLESGAVIRDSWYGVVSSGTVVMRGGEIRDNGIGVLNTGSFTLDGGKIKRNGFAMNRGSDLEVGGVQNIGTNAVFTMNGGEISYNYGGKYFFGGGGVRNEGGASFIMNDGEIRGNTAQYYGGGISNLTANGYTTTLTLNGGIMAENSVGADLDYDYAKRGAYGGAIYCGPYNTTIIPFDLSSVTVGENFVFENNSAPYSYYIRENNILSHNWRVFSHSFTAPFEYAYNNCDIAYRPVNILLILKNTDAYSSAPIEGAEFQLQASHDLSETEYRYREPGELLENQEITDSYEGYDEDEMRRLVSEEGVSWDWIYDNMDNFRCMVYVIKTFIVDWQNVGEPLITGEDGKISRLIESENPNYFDFYPYYRFVQTSADENYDINSLAVNYNNGKKKFFEPEFGDTAEALATSVKLKANYRVEYYSGSITPANLIETVTGSALYGEGHQLTAQDINTDLGENWINAKKPASGYNGGSIQGGYPVISMDEKNNVVKVLYTVSGGGGGGGVTPPTQYYTVNASFKDSSGNTISELQTKSVAKNNSFNLSAHAIEGYRYSETVINGVSNTNRDVSIESVTKDYDIIFRYKLDRPALEDKNHNWYVRGYPENTIKPEGELTRAEAALLFFRLVANSDKETKNPRKVFNDIDPNAWYAKALTYLFDYDVVSGYTDGSYKPDEFITRAEIAKIACMFDNLDMPDENVFTDVPQGHWAYSYISSAARKGWIHGYNDGTFQPDQFTTRAEMVTLINNMLNRHIKREDIPATVHNWNDLATDYWAYADIIEAAHSHIYERKEAALCEIWLEITGDGLTESFDD